MPLRPILAVPDPRLRQPSIAVETFDIALMRLGEDLVDTLLSTSGIGLSAPQIGVNKRVIVLELSRRSRDPEILVNPRVLGTSTMGIVEESCLSIPGVSERVVRATHLRFRAQTLTGRVIERDADGMEAVCIQHEIDHLEGRLFVDRLPLQRRLWLRLKGFPIG
jgi:peptide deformylase